MKRYDLWAVSQKDQAGPEKAKPLEEVSKACQDRFPVKPQTGKLDDLQTSLLLYHYGLPINTVLEASGKMPDGRPMNCKTKSISSERVDLLYASPQSGRCDKKDIGSPVHVDLDEVGAVKGVIASQNKDGFQIAVDANSRASMGDRLADFAIRHDIKHDVSIAAGPDIQRLVPINKSCCFEDHNGRLRNGTIVNLSKVDVLIRTHFVPPKPAIILFRGPRQYAAEITNVFAIGFMAKFSTPISDQDFSASIRFTD